MSRYKAGLYNLVGLVALIAVFWIIKTAFQMVAFRPLGNTENYLEAQLTADQPPALVAGSLAQPVSSSNFIDLAITAAPTASQIITSPLKSVTVDIWFLSKPMQFSAKKLFASRLERACTAGGQAIYYIEFTEEGLNQYLNYWFGNQVEKWRLRNAWLELKPGGIVINADIDLGVGWQRIGGVFQLEANERQFAFAGVDIGGQLYATPPAGPVADAIHQLEADGNRALRELLFVDAAGNLHIQRISINEHGAQITAY